MPMDGFLRVAAAVPVVTVANCTANAQGLLELMAQAETKGVDVLVFPELCLTGYTCGDLFHNDTLLASAESALADLLVNAPKTFSGLFAVGLPLASNGQVFNCAVLCQGEQILGVVPKTYLPNYKEFYEDRWFTSANYTVSSLIQLADQDVPFGTDFLFEATNINNCVVGVEICEDLWVPVPPSCYQSLQGATLLINLSSGNEIIGKMQYRRDLVKNQSGRCLAAYVYAGSGVHESTTDLVFSGHSLIAENARILAESERFSREPSLTIADVDLQLLHADRLRMNTFAAFRTTEEETEFVRIPFELPDKRTKPNFYRFVDAHPFVPKGKDSLAERCQEIFQIQVAGLAKRLQHIGGPNVAIGVSGGLDSTLSLLVTCKTMDLLGHDRQKIKAFTMPGFGTSQRTKGNSQALMRLLGVNAREVDIRSLCLAEMQALNHRPFGIDLTGLNLETFQAKLNEVPSAERQDLVFENVQARMRTSILMNSAFVIGTGDVSELALGWCTYNADHMSMYNPNVSIPKTLVKFLVRWVAETEFTGETRKVLFDIVDTEITPELLPLNEDNPEVQSTEKTIGPYELHDFFLYHFLRHGSPPQKILFLASQAEFDNEYSEDEIRHWLMVFLRRFFQNQFKRSCLPDGPKVGSISVSPRGDWRMPSDADVADWLKELEK